MITIIVPEWFLWTIGACFLIQWTCNIILAYYKNKAAKHYNNMLDWAKKAAESVGIKEYK